MGIYILQQNPAAIYCGVLLFRSLILPAAAEGYGTLRRWLYVH